MFIRFLKRKWIYFLWCVFATGSIVYAQNYPKEVKAGKPRKNSGASCSLHFPKEMQGKGRQNNPYRFVYKLSCPTTSYLYQGKGEDKEEYFQIIGLEKKQLYKLRVKREKGNSTMIFRPKGNLPGISGSRIQIQVQKGFSTDLLADSGQSFHYSLSTNPLSLYRVTIMPSKIQVVSKREW